MLAFIMVRTEYWFRLVVCSCAAVAALSCTDRSRDEHRAEDDERPTSLREAAARAGKSVGVAVRELALADEPAFREVLLREFDAVTPENSMKWGPLAPSATSYDWTRADAFVDFAEEHALEIKGHTLVWDEQMPTWLTRSTPAEELREALRLHIQTTVARYRGRISKWDVVNEAVDADTNSGFTESIFPEKLGPEFIRDAFHWAHEADPDAALYYNEVGIERVGPKSDFTYELIRGLVEEGVPIHGVGLQSHVSTHRYPAESNLRANIRRFAALGLRVHVSELDARTLLQGGDREGRLWAQRIAFQQVVGACTLEPGCEGVTFWGFTDRHSWIVDEEPEEAPLLFDRDYEVKPAYLGALDGLLGRVLERGSNVIENGDLSEGTDGWAGSGGELVLETIDDAASVCHTGRTHEGAELRWDRSLAALTSGGPYALSALVRLRGGGPARIQAELYVGSGAAAPVRSNIGGIVAGDAEWIELAGYFGLGFDTPPDFIGVSFHGAPADVDVCLAAVQIQPLSP